MKTRDKKAEKGVDRSKKRRLETTAVSREVRGIRKSKGLQLTEEDYQDLIEIKRERASKERNLGRLFWTIGLTLSMAFLNLAFNWKTYDDGTVTALELLQNDDFEEVLDVPLTEQKPPPPPQSLIPPRIVEVSDEEIIEDIEITIDVEASEETVIEAIEFVDEPIEEEEIEEIFQIVEKNPEPVGGVSAFYKYVNENIEYPRAARRGNVQGKVFVKFVVDKDGNIKDVKAIKGIGSGCDEEAERIVANSPKWNPGKQRGKSVSVYMMLPITFKLVD